MNIYFNELKIFLVFKFRKFIFHISSISRFRQIFSSIYILKLYEILSTNN